MPLPRIATCEYGEVEYGGLPVNYAVAFSLLYSKSFRYLPNADNLSTHEAKFFQRCISSWVSPKARKGFGSGIAGGGLFTIEQICAGEIVAVKGGHIVTTTQLRQLPDPLPNSEIQIADGLRLAALSTEDYEPVMVVYQLTPANLTSASRATSS